MTYEQLFRRNNPDMDNDTVNYIMKTVCVYGVFTKADSGYCHERCNCCWKNEVEVPYKPCYFGSIIEKSILDKFTKLW